MESMEETRQRMERSRRLLPGKDQHVISTPPARPATDSQRRFISDLRIERDDTGMGDTPEDMTVETARKAIEWLIKRPRKTNPVRLPEGIYEMDGGVYRVTESNTSGNLYVLILNLDPDEIIEPGTKMIWLHDPSLMTYRQLCARNPGAISAERAAQIGHLFDRCIFCNRPLSLDPSVEAGYGPDCAERYGLPYGSGVC